MSFGSVEIVIKFNLYFTNTSSVQTLVTQPDIQAECLPPPPATITTMSSAAEVIGTKVSGLVWSIQLGQTLFP